MLANRLQWRIALSVTLGLVLLGLLYLNQSQDYLSLREHIFGDKLVPDPASSPDVPVDHGSHKVELVVASTKAEDTAWVTKHFPDWHPQIYVVNNKHATLTVPKNKGREAMVYLTYIIDNYDDLPENVVFIHASRFAWHNDDPDYDAVPTLRNLQLDYVAESGYVNLRCVWVIGCPYEIHPFQDAGHKDEGSKTPSAKGVYKQAFEELLPGTQVPELVAVSCCSQFAVTRQTLQTRPRSDYEHFRDWLLKTPLTDDLSGRVLEFLWHILFGKDAVFCPSAATCYCKVFGHCNSTCTDSACDGRYTLPPYSQLPKGWPLIGWKDEHRNYTGELD
ncbi:uncharacterized protein B0I36DRAFT_329351 [Microdochium trichocladiopsis]|uniref:Uncharacterized protein n=1 Tax=Microdochium trichocladiopsis TaxID=1682393 RepID=A0A9P9BM37_9PEZI|nr:uncharacterized protein B0I36DRAFT_329351 [Microdochium trichocladiopsis]KAH7025885.1 hypothetical protein B0I36DRAFT_329351 [Microdochium trichocladiopsis]